MEIVQTIQNMKTFVAQEGNAKAYSVFNEAYDILLNYFSTNGHVYDTKTLSRAHEVFTEAIWDNSHYPQEIFSVLTQAESLLNGAYEVANVLEKWNKVA